MKSLKIIAFLMMILAAPAVVLGAGGEKTPGIQTEDTVARKPAKIKCGSLVIDKDGTIKATRSDGTEVVVGTTNQQVEGK